MGDENFVTPVLTYTKFISRHSGRLAKDFLDLVILAKAHRINNHAPNFINEDVLKQVSEYLYLWRRQVSKVPENTISDFNYML